MNFSLSKSSSNKKTPSISIQLGGTKKQSSALFNNNQTKTSNYKSDQKIESLFSEQDEEEESTINHHSKSLHPKSKSSSSSAMTQSLLFQKIQHEKKKVDPQQTVKSSLQDIDQWELVDHEQDQKSESIVEHAFENMKNVISKTYTQKLSEKDSNPQESKYIANLVKLAEERKKEKELAQIRRMQKESSINSSHTVFVTEEYKQKLKEQERWTEEKEREKEEELKKNVTKIGMGNFYKSLLSSSTRHDVSDEKSNTTTSNTTTDERDHKETCEISTKSDLYDHPQQQHRGIKRKQETSLMNESRSPVGQSSQSQISSSEMKSSFSLEQEDQPQLKIVKIDKEEAVLSARERYLRRLAEKKQEQLSK
ncbi:hypothetical protein FDP41_001261 [Naegleria fowleri]|uniref:Nuclear speckle splicing regulatory protein 1 N-terminal domain-containing protein n=1 Tax=Naegleria fowleri TaxID=5763 RepID=A0A6A5BNL8_NAEFO|nr:uncharacterized protein FDP41_001261 [Naegleria fowleri]KAF0979593.1 hypothetical protein FDP41_001261 [Naegleria fowleri]